MAADPSWQPPSSADEGPAFHAVKGLVWRTDGRIMVNESRPFIPDLNQLPLPMHHLLPLKRYTMPLMKGPFSFIVTSRGCPAGCTYCIKHVTYQSSVRLLSPERIMQELLILRDLGVTNIHMYADLFTGLKIRWTCNSRVDFVDQEMLTLMGKAGCWMIAWGLESGNERILRNAHKGASPSKARNALLWSKKAGIRNWGYFIIGLPGETVATIRETIAFSKSLPLDVALFHVAAPYPGTPFFFEVVKNGWFKEGTRWEQVDMDKGTVLQYPDISPEELLNWQRRAFREWALRPGPMWTYAKMLLSDYRTFKQAWRAGIEHLGWILGRRERQPDN
jgi:radical SAM superfamily enzyme YgiQ (UPF0313 family)